MHCPACKKGIMQKTKGVMEQDGIEFEIFRCVACGEEIMNMEQLKILAQAYRKLRKAKEVIFAKWGNSIAVRIPSDIVEEYHIQSGKHGILTTDKNGIKIIPAKS